MRTVTSVVVGLLLFLGIVLLAYSPINTYWPMFEVEDVVWSVLDRDEIFPRQ